MADWVGFFHTVYVYDGGALWPISSRFVVDWKHNQCDRLFRKDGQ